MSRYPTGPICINGHPKRKKGRCQECRNARERRYRAKGKVLAQGPVIFRELATTPWLASI
jgi:hypothetical protein